MPNLREFNEEESELPFLPTVSADHFLPAISKWVTLGEIFLLLGFFSTLGLSAVLKYKVVVKAPAVVRPQGELRLVQSPIEAKVKSIELDYNQQKVSKDQVLAYLDDSQLKAKKIQLEESIKQNSRQLNQLNAQIVALEKQINAETEQKERLVALAQAQLRLSQRIYEDKSQTSEKVLEEAVANHQQAVEELEKGKQDLKAESAQLKSIQAAVKAAQSKRSRYQTIADSGVISQEQLEEAILLAEQQEQVWQSQLARVEAQKKTIDRLQMEVKATQAQVEQAEVSLNPSVAEIEISQQKIAQEQATGASVLASLKREREQLKQQQAQITEQLNNSQQDLNQVAKNLENTVVKSPVDGTIQKINLRNVNQVLAIGEEIAQIAPSTDQLILKASVPSGDISKVAIEQPVKIKISACPYPDYGLLDGTVQTIAPDTLRQENQNSSNYQVTIELSQSVLTANNQECPILSGMEGEAQIISKQETILHFLLRKARLITDI